MSTRMPTGTVTLMFTDIEGSTRLWDEFGKVTMLPILDAHNRILRRARDNSSGYEMRSEGDGFLFAFSKAADAVQCAIEAQLALDAHSWPEATGKIRVRMGIHTGDVEQLDGEYQGIPANIAKRITEAGHGGQILISAATHELVSSALPSSWFSDLGMYRLRNLHQSVRMFQVTHPELKRDFPALRTIDSTPNNLPAPLTSFIGRDAEKNQISELLRNEQVRLITLTGAGGIGKTRLSIEVAAEQLEHFPDGVWFVSLESLTAPAYVITEIASALSIPLQPKGDPTRQVIDYLSQKHLLLVLDNFEHLPEAANVVSEILRSVPGLRCLVTSRQLMRVSGEQRFVVPPLPTPPRDTQVIETLSQYESVQLFIERARAVKSDFKLTSQNAPAISAICHHLDGIPLAIELAAARVRGMTVQQILERLSQRFEFLATRSQDVPSRHRTLRAALDWSYGLLDPDEKELLAQLSVFPGGFFLEAAEEICDVPDVFELIFSLHDKSLLTVEEVLERSRYRLLEPLRAYAQEKLEESVSLQRAHAAYYRGVAQKLDQKLAGAEQSLALSWMALELDNFRAAMDFAQAEGEYRLLGELGIALSRFFQRSGIWFEGTKRLRQAEVALRKLDHKSLLAIALHGLGRFYQSQGDYETACALYAESLQVARELGDKPRIAASLNNLGLIAENQGEYEEARQLYTQSLQIKRELGDKPGISNSLGNLGLVAQYRGDYEEARQLHTQSLQISRELENKWGIAHSLNNLGLIAQHQGDCEEARQLHTQSLQIARELGSKRGIAIALNNLGNIERRRGEYREARKLLTESLQMSRELGDKQSIAHSLNNLGNIARRQGQYGEAKQLLTESLQISNELGDKRNMAESLSNLGDIARIQQAYHRSRQLLIESLQIIKELGDKRGIAESLHQFGKLTEAEGHAAQAVLFLLHAARLYEEMHTANSTEAEEVAESLAQIQKAIEPEQFEGMNKQLETMAVEEVVDLALAWES